MSNQSGSNPAPTNAQASWNALKAGRAFYRRDPGDVVLLSGGDVRDFLQRVSASAITAHPDGSTVPMVLTSDKGRVVDMTYLLLGSAGDILLTGQGAGPRVAAWIEGYVITEDVNVAPLPQGVLTLVGRATIEVVSAMAAKAVETNAEAGPGDTLGLIEEPATATAVAHALVPPSTEASVQAALARAGILEVSEESFAGWCIHSLRLRPGVDLDESMNPLEAGLRHHVSFTKGCYIGQEVVARLDTYDKVRRRPALLKTSSAPARGASVTSQGRRVGWIVASTLDIAGDGPHALAVLSRELDPGAPVNVDGRDREEHLAGQVVAVDDEA